jgi:hypothetical protein
MRPRIYQSRPATVGAIRDKYRNVEEVFDNYKLVAGIMTPHSVTRYLNGDMSYQKFLNEVVFNHDLPDNCSSQYHLRSFQKFLIPMKLAIPHFVTIELTP